MILIGITIREATKGDILDIKAIARAIIKENYKPFLGDDLVRRFIDSGVPDNYIALNLDYVKVAESENVVVGFCVLKGNTIEVIMVSPDMHMLSIDVNILDQLRKEYNINLLQYMQRKTHARGFYVKTGLNTNNCLIGKFGI